MTQLVDNQEFRLPSLPGQSDVLPNLIQVMSGIAQAFPGLASIVPVLAKRLPGLAKAMPNILDALPDLLKSLPGVLWNLPELERALPGLIQQIKVLTLGGKCENDYVVQGGDTCWQISIKKGISLDTFFSLNPDIDCSNLQIGQIVCV
jgi:hypothetical protein